MEFAFDLKNHTFIASLENSSNPSIPDYIDMIYEIFTFSPKSIIFDLSNIKKLTKNQKLLLNKMIKKISEKYPETVIINNSLNFNIKNITIKNDYFQAFKYLRSKAIN